MKLNVTVLALVAGVFQGICQENPSISAAATPAAGPMILAAPSGTMGSGNPTASSLAGNLPAEPLVLRLNIEGRETMVRFNRSQLLEQLGQFRSTYEFAGEPFDSVLAGLAKVMGKGFELPVSSAKDSVDVKRPVYARYVDRTPEEVFHDCARSAGYVVRYDANTYRLVSPNSVRREDLVLRVYETKYINIYNFADALQALLSPVGRFVPNTAIGAKSAAAAGGGAIVTVKAAGGGSASGGGGGGGSGGGGGAISSVSTDKDIRDAALPLNSFSVSILDIPEVHETVAKFLASVDHPRKQVAVQMRLYEFSKSQDPSGNHLGIDWTKTLNGYGVQSVNTATPRTPLTFDPTMLLAGGINFFSPNNFLVQSPALSATLYAIESKGNGRLVEAPNILAQHGVTAVLKSVDRRPYNAGSVDTTAGGSSQSVQSISFAEIGTTLNVTPFIEEDTDPDPAKWTLYLDLKPEISIQGPDVVINGNPVPSFAARAPTTQCRIRNGDTVFLGGINSRSVKETWVGLPGMSQVPVLKYIFGSKTKGVDEREIAILVTANIVDIDQKLMPNVNDPELMKQIRAEYGKKDFLVVPQGTSPNDPAVTTGNLIDQSPKRQVAATRSADPEKLRRIQAERDRLEEERAQKFQAIADDFAKRDAALKAQETQVNGK